MVQERTFLAIKPEAYKRGDAVAITEMLCTRLQGAKCLGMKAYTPSRELAEKHYEAHKDKPFFGDLVKSFTSGPILGMVWEGKGIVAKAREVMGATNPEKAEEGTIRKRFGKSLEDNAIHGSDTDPGSADREIKLHFPLGEVDFSVIAEPLAKAKELTVTWSKL
jgi:nucleoside-diphosphate kinase